MTTDKYLNNATGGMLKQEEFFALLAHDLKSPICAQQRALELLLHGAFGEFNDVQTDIIKLLYNSSLYSKMLVNDILDVYKYKKDEYQIQPEILDFVGIINECVRITDYMIVEKQIKITLDVPTTCMLLADKVAIKRVVMNLLCNAIKYSPQNSIVSIKLCTESQEIVFSVSNNSTHIPDEILQNIFKKDYCVLNPNSKSGTGLGLFLVNKIIEAHAGVVFASSSPDGNNIFGFRLKALTDKYL